MVPCVAGVQPFQGDVLIRDGSIKAVGPNLAAAQTSSCVVRDASGHAVLPGFIQGHVHLCQTIMRGLADGLALLPWLRGRIWPLEAAHTEQSLRTSAELGIAELLSSGTTTILDMGTTHHHDVVFDACDRMGIRALSGKAMMDLGDGVPKSLCETTSHALQESDRLRRVWHGAAAGRLRYAYAPRFVLSCSETLVRETVAASEACGCLMHTHASEHPEEQKAVRAILGHDDVQVLANWGLRGPRAVYAHGVQLTSDQIRMIREHASGVVHCPSANMKLGSGIAPVADLLRAGIRVGLGADGAACNNNLDPFTELRHAALLASLRYGPDAVAPEDLLGLVTLGGARVLGLETEIGSLEPGKRADVVVVSLQGLHQQPLNNVARTLVYATKASDVRDVIVDGQILVQDGVLVNVDADHLRVRANEEACRLIQRAAIVV